MTAYDYLDILSKHNVNPSGMGCVMLDVKPLPINNYFGPTEMSIYGAYDPNKKWVTGFQTGEQHLTLKYGLLSNANVIKDDVDALLEGIDFEDDLFVGHIEVFEQDADYSCVVALVETGREGDEAPGSIYLANERLSYLPHIDTFSTYRPHVTIGYVYDEYVDAVVKVLWDLPGTKLEPIGLNYGYPPA